MFTECPQPSCRSIYRISVKQLREAMGMVRCKRCRTVFNALSTLREGPEAADVETIGVQLPFASRGDRIVVGPATTADPGRDSGRTREQLVTRAASHPSTDAAPSSAAGTEAPRNKETDDAPAAVDIATATPQRAGYSGPSLGRFRSLALRNLIRQRRRTAFALAAIGAGVFGLLIASGFIEWIFGAMRDDAIYQRLGHIQIVRDGYFDEGTGDPFSYLLPPDSQALQSIKTAPHVSVVTPRLKFGALVSHNDTTVSALVEGISPDSERIVSRGILIQDGRGLEADDRNGVELGAGLAANLDASVGDTVVLLANTSSGGMNAVEGTVRGIFVTASKAFDDSAMRIHIDNARDLLRAEGAHSWVVVLDSTDRTRQVASSLESRLSGFESLEVVTWTTLADFYNKTVVLFSRQVHVVQAIIGLVIVLSISNTMLMNVMERTGEVGTMLAVGIRRRIVLRQFLIEAVLLGIGGGVIGLVVGYIAAQIISSIGIPMPPPPGMAIGVTGRIDVTPTIAMGAVGLAILSTLLAGLYPAWKASRLEIVDALRHNR